MAHGGGSFVLGGDGENYAAIGHNAVYTFDGADYLIATHTIFQMKADPNYSSRKLNGMSTAGLLFGLIVSTLSVQQHICVYDTIDQFIQKQIPHF